MQPEKEGFSQKQQKFEHEVAMATGQSMRDWEKALAPANMESMDVAPEVSRDAKGWLKATAFKNIFCMLVTLEVSLNCKGWLKARAP